ncbi:CO5A3 protein, partial [Eudromia elegans]|nr:CO5A3 protein [Eudromia elegans]
PPTSNSHCLQGALGPRGDPGPPGPPGPPVSVGGGADLGTAPASPHPGGFIPRVPQGRPAEMPEPLPSIGRRRREAPGGAGGLEEVLASLGSLRAELEGLRRPRGTARSPARVCRELQLCHPELSDGEYWIDPNQGCSRDAFRVFCNFTAGGETCLFPEKKLEAVSGSGKRHGAGAALRFSYVDADGRAVPVPQLTFLRLLSAHARQSFTLRCQNAAAWFDAASGSFSRALRLRGADGEELGPGGPVRALHDGCRHRRGQERTVLEVASSRVERLPLMDVAVSDFGGANQKFGFELGPVCFL